MQAAQRAGLAEAFEGGVEERTLAGGWGFKWEGRQVLGARAWQRAGSRAALAGGSVAWSHACRRLSGSVSVSSGGGASSRILNEALVQRARASEKLHGDRLRPDGPPASPPSLRVPSATVEGQAGFWNRPSAGSRSGSSRDQAGPGCMTCCGQGQGLVWLRPRERRPPSPPGRARLPGPPGSVRPRRGDAV